MISSYRYTRLQRANRISLQYRHSIEPEKENTKVPHVPVRNGSRKEPHKHRGYVFPNLSPDPLT